MTQEQEEMFAWLGDVITEQAALNGVTVEQWCSFTEEAANLQELHEQEYF